MPKNHLFAFGLALLACLLWSGNFLTARGVHEWVPPFALCFWRWSIATAVISSFAWPHVRAQWPLICRHWKYLAIMGAFSVGIYNTLVYLAAHHTTAHHIALISSTAPIWTLLIAGFSGTERLSRFKTGGAALAFMGALIIISHGEWQAILSFNWNRGDLMLLLGAWIWGAYSVLLHYKPKEMHTLTFLNSIFVVGLLFITPLYAWEVASGHPTPFTKQAWAVYAYVGICASVIAWFCWNSAVHAIGSVKASLVYYTIPVFSSILAYLYLKEPLMLYHFVGFGLILAGIIVSNLRKLGLAHR